MDLGKLIFEAIEQAKSENLGAILTNIKRIDFALAQSVDTKGAYKLIDQLECTIKKVESTYKTYILGVMTDDKTMRIESMNNIKTFGEDITSYLKGFKKHWNEHLKDCIKSNKCDKHDH